jgi:micrococcal nuclease
VPTRPYRLPRPFRFRRRPRGSALAALAIALLAAALLGLALAGRGGDDVSVPGAPSATAVARGPGPTSTALGPTTAPALPDLRPDPRLLQAAEVVDVIDGDTIDVRIDGREERVRYYGIDTPERGDRCYREATDRNEVLAGARVLLLPDARERDRSGRLLRYVFAEDGASIDARLIAEGLALAWRDDGAHRDELVALEERARAAEVGCLWE